MLGPVETGNATIRQPSPPDKNGTRANLSISSAICHGGNRVSSFGPQHRGEAAAMTAFNR